MLEQVNANEGRARALRLVNLDGVRLIAALAVLGFHFFHKGVTDGLYLESLPAYFKQAGNFGYLGVNLFFCISGFVIAYSAVGRRPAEFAASRIARIYPTFLFCLLITFVARYFWGGNIFPTSVNQFAANIFLVPQLFGEQFMDGVYWSLIVEVVFYFWIMLLLILGALWRFELIVVGLWLLISMVNEAYFNNALVGAIFLTDYAPYFATGMLLHSMLRGQQSISLISGLFLAALLVSGAFIVRETQAIALEEGQFVDSQIALLVFFGGLVLLVLAVLVEKPVLPRGFLLWAGGISYPLYLLHEIIGWQVIMALLPNYAAPISFATAIAFVLLLSSLVWWGFDQDVVPWVRRKILEVLDSLPRLRIGGLSRPSPSE